MNDFCTVKSKKELSCILEKDKNACFGSNKVPLEKKLRNPFKHKLFALFFLGELSKSRLNLYLGNLPIFLYFHIFLFRV